VPVDARRPPGGRADPAGRRPETRQGVGPVRRQPTHPGPAESRRRADQAQVFVADQDEKAIGTRAGGRQEKDARQAIRRRSDRQEISETS